MRKREQSTTGAAVETPKGAAPKTTGKIPPVVQEEQGEKSAERWGAALAWAETIVKAKKIIVNDGKDFFGAGSHTREAFIHFVYFTNTHDYATGKALATPTTGAASDTILKVQALQVATGCYVKGEKGRVSTAGAVNAHRASLKNKYFDGTTQVYAASDSPKVTKAKGGEYLTPSAYKAACENYASRKFKLKG
jgi:hypothetical protein